MRSLSQANNVTTGRIYLNVITKERRGEYLRFDGAGDPAHHHDEIKAAMKAPDTRHRRGHCGDPEGP